MSIQRIRNLRLHLHLKSIKAIAHYDLSQILSPAHACSSRTSRPICMKSENSSQSFLPPEHLKIVDGLISIFTKQPFHPDSQEVRDLGSKLTTKIVETVLQSLKSWRIAHLFFTWASDQCGYKHNCYTYNAMASILSRARQNDPLRILATDLVDSRCWMPPGALGFFVRCLSAVGMVEEAILFFDQAKNVGLCVPNNYSYNCLLEAISRSNSLGLIEERLKEMRDSGWEPDKYTLTPVLKCYCTSGKFEKALEVFNIMYEKGWVDNHVLTILVLSFSKWGEIDKAFELIERMENLNASLNEKTFSILIHGFVRESKVEKALQLFGKMRKLGFVPDMSIYGVLMWGLCKNKDIDKALYLYSKMKELGIYPDVEILKKLVSSFPEEREMIKLLEERQEVLGTEAMIQLYNSVLNDLINNSSVDKAYYLLRTLMGDVCNGDVDVEVDKPFTTKKLVRPDTNSFNIVINSLCQSDNLDRALGLFQDMDRVNCKRSLLLYNNLIDSLSNSNRVEECYELLTEMKEKGFQPTQFTYNSIFGCLCRREDVAGALGLAKEMRVNGHEPWIKHTTLLVKQLCKHGRANDAYNFLGNIVQEGFHLDIIPYSAAIDGFIKIQEVDHALQLFRDIGARGYCADVVAYNIIINGLCKASRVSEAQDVLNEMLGKGLVPSVVTYNSFIDGWCKCGDIDQAMLCLSTLVGKEREPNVVTYTTLIDGFCKAQRPNDALELWTKMKENGCSPNLITYTALIHGLCKCARPDDAIVYFQDMEEKGMTPATFVYDALIDAFIKCARPDDAIVYFQDMEEKGMTPGTFVHVALIDAFISNSNPLLAFEILKKMLHRGMFPDLNEKNHLIIREAIFKLSEDARTSSDIKRLMAEGKISITSSVLDAASEDGHEPVI
ncbi:hypothetical protein U1Q18_015553 [Sarracenia purpurea var. burkii]